MKAWIALFAAVCLAQAETAKAASVAIQEVVDPHPEIALQQARAAAQAAYGATPGEAYLLDPIEINAGLVILDQLVNLGQALWSIVAAGKPVANIAQDVANAVPKGVASWNDLTNWGNPTTKLYHTQIATGYGTPAGDFYFRMLFTGGGSYQGAGKYLTGVTIMPAELTVTYDKNFSAKTIVGTIVNHGTDKQPIAGMDMTLQWAVDTTWSHSQEQITFHVRGDSNEVQILASPDDQAQDVKGTSSSNTSSGSDDGSDPWPYPDYGIDDGIGPG